MASNTQDIISDKDNLKNFPEIILEKYDNMITSTPSNNNSNSPKTPKTTSDIIKARAKDLSNKQQLEKKVWLDHVANLEEQLREKDLELARSNDYIQKLQEDVESLSQSLKKRSEQIEELKAELIILNQSNEERKLSFSNIINTQPDSFYKELTIEEAKQFLRGLDSIMEDFIRTGRKTLSDDETAELIKRQQKSLLNFTKIWNIDDNGSLTKIQDGINPKLKEKIIGNWDNLLNQMSTIVKELTKQVDAIKKSKATYIPYYELVIKLKSIIEYEAKISKDLLMAEEKEDSNELQKIFTNLQPTIERIVEKTIQNQHSVVNKKQPILSKKQHSILLKLSSNKKVDQILPVLEEKITRPEIYSKILTTKKTKNNNIKIQLETSQDKVELLNYLNQDDRLNQEVHTIDLDKRKVDLLLLNIPVHITQETLENEIKRFSDDDVHILNPIKTKSTNLFHWRLQTSPSMARKLLQKKRLPILMNTYTLVKYVRIMRCTNCQNFGHTQRYCKIINYCANCAQEHPTSECNSDSQACVNCLRTESEPFDHKATSPACPIYQYIKTNFLNNYYKKNINQNRRLPNNENDKDYEEELIVSSGNNKIGPIKNTGQNVSSRIPNKKKEKVIYLEQEEMVEAAAINIDKIAKKYINKFKNVNEVQLRKMLEKRFRDINLSQDRVNHQNIQSANAHSPNFQHYDNDNIHHNQQDTRIHQNEQYYQYQYQTGPSSTQSSVNNVQEENYTKTYAEATASSEIIGIQQFKQRQLHQSQPPLTNPNNIPLSFDPKGKRTSVRDSHLQKYIKNPPPPFTSNGNKHYE